MEDQTGTVLQWSNQKEPKKAKSKDEVTRKNLDRIRISGATPLPSNALMHSQVSIIKNNNNNTIKKEPRSKKLKNSGCQNMCPIGLNL